MRWLELQIDKIEARMKICLLCMAAESSRRWNFGLSFYTFNWQTFFKKSVGVNIVS